MNVVGPVWQCPIVAYGPGDSSLDHTPNEHLSLDEYWKAVNVIEQTLSFAEPRRGGTLVPPARSPSHRHQRRKNIDRLPKMADADVFVRGVLVVVEVHHRQPD